MVATPALSPSFAAERRSYRQNLDPLLRAHSVAIIGLSQLPRFGGWVYQNLRNIGYTGRIYGVNPRYTTLYDQPCYPSLHDLSNVPECAILALPNERLLPALREAAALGVKAAIIPASAYSGPVEGQPTLQQQLAQIARESGMVLCGPNCMGFIAFASRFCATGYPLAAGVPGGSVAFITHSGSVFDAMWQNTRNIHFNYLISSGNEIVTTLADYMQFALGDPTTAVIGLFLETVRDPATFRAALEEAAERDVPVVALKVGRSTQGAQLAQTHSGALAGDDAVYNAIFAHYGVRRVKTLDEMMDTLELFAAGIRPTTRFIASIHDSGGERGMLVDLAEAEGVQFAPINADTTQKLAAILEPGLAPINPLDAWGTGNDFGPIYLNSMLALDADPSTGLNVWVADLYPSGTVSATYVSLAIENKARFTKPLVFLTNTTSVASPELAAKLRQAGIPLLMGTATGLQALRHLLEYSAYQRQRQIAGDAKRGSRGAEEVSNLTHDAPRTTHHALRHQFRQTLQSASGPLDESASKNILRAYGIPTPPEAIAGSLDEALQAAQQIGYPVALKTAGGELHKSDKGGVLLDLHHAEALTIAYHRLASTFGPRVLVQKMASQGVELILGLVNDAQFGPLLTLGLGGIFVEIMQDTTLLALPTTHETVRAALLGLKGAPLLKGARGRLPTDMGAIVDATLHLAHLAADLGDLIAAVDINPLIALPEGVVAVDALIIPDFLAQQDSL